MDRSINNSRCCAAIYFCDPYCPNMMLTVKDRIDSLDESQRSLEDRKRDLHLLELELKILELEAGKIQACSASTTSHLSASKPACSSSSLRGSLTSLISANDPASRPASPSISNAAQPLRKQSRPPSNFNSPRTSLADFDRHSLYANCLSREFVQGLAKSAAEEIRREREALQLANDSKHLTDKGKILALQIETSNIKQIVDSATKLADKIKIQSHIFKLDQFYRWIHKNWTEKTERDLRWLQLKINQEERYQQQKLFSERSAADIELLETNNMKMEQQLNMTVTSLHKLHQENCTSSSQNQSILKSADKVSSEVENLQRQLLTRRRKIHEKDSMKFSLEMRNQSLVRHVLNIEEVNQYNAKKFGIQAIPNLEFVSDWAKMKDFERGLRQELDICRRRKSMLAFQVQKAKSVFQKDHEKEVVAGPQCSPADTLRQNTKSDFETSTSNLSTHSSTAYQLHPF